MKAGHDMSADWALMTSNRKQPVKTFQPIVVFAAATGGLAGCANSPNVFDPKGPAAAEIAQLGWILVGLGTAVFGVVMGLLFYAILRRRSPEADVAAALCTPPAVTTKRWVVLGGIVFPALVLAVILFFTITTLQTISTLEAAEGLTVEVIGRQWWWEVRYPAEQVTTANEIHIPVGQPVRLVLKAGDVIHSFWVPELAGKMDLLPGQTNSLWLQAEEAGTYRGLCAEFCGIQHAKMQYLVVAVPPAEFNTWLARQQQPAPAPTDERIRYGQQLFLGSACVYCHTVRGTNASGQLGPDLTHVASRQTLAAGILPNNRGTLAGWILNPQHIKPGNLMPPTHLSGGELQALLDYLGTLQ